MIRKFLAPYAFKIAATAAIALVGYIGVLNVQLATERRTVAMLDADLRTEQGKYETCSARLTNILEREDSDASVPDNLDGFPVPDDWMLRLLDGTGTPGD